MAPQFYRFFLQIIRVAIFTIYFYRHKQVLNHSPAQNRFPTDDEDSQIVQNVTDACTHIVLAKGMILLDQTLKN